MSRQLCLIRTITHADGSVGVHVPGKSGEKYTWPTCMCSGFVLDGIALILIVMEIRVA